MATADKHRQRSHRSYRQNKENFNYYASMTYKRFFGTIGGSPKKSSTKKKRKFGKRGK